jgi:hypothetical protein
MDNEVFGYSIREPSVTELKFFKEQSGTAGYAAPDGTIVLNPFSKLSQSQKMAVAQNEAARLWMREKRFDPQFKLTQEQVESFKGSPYELDTPMLKQTIIGRIISQDKSAMNFTPEQQAHADYVHEFLKRRSLK